MGGGDNKFIKHFTFGDLRQVWSYPNFNRLITTIFKNIIFRNSNSS